MSAQIGESFDVLTLEDLLSLILNGRRPLLLKQRRIIADALHCLATAARLLLVRWF